jgi:hypothetical protein
MKNNKQQTAVEWYSQQIVDKQNGNGDSRSLDEIFEQAKALHKEEIINIVVWCDDTNRRPQQIKIEAEQYYEQTYGGNK